MNKKQIIKKVRKEIKPKKEDVNLMHTVIGQNAALEYLKNKTAQKIEIEIKEEKNHAITIILVWLALLIVVMIYKSL